MQPKEILLLFLCSTKRSEAVFLVGLSAVLTHRLGRLQPRAPPIIRGPEICHEHFFLQNNQNCKGILFKREVILYFLLKNKNFGLININLRGPFAICR